MSKSDLVPLLIEALRGRRPQAIRLAEVFQQGVDSYVADQANAANQRERLLRQVDAADQIVTAARQLLRRLEVHDFEVHRAVTDGFLTVAEGIRRGNYASLGEMMGWMRWNEGEECRSDLKHLLRAAANWKLRAGAQAKRPRGRSTGDRLLLAGWIADVLRREGISLTKSRTGTFARILKAVYTVAAIETRDPYRDIATVLRRHEKN